MADPAQKFNDFSVPAAGSRTGRLYYNVGSCCGDIHDGISLNLGDGAVVISKESFDLICLAVDEYYHQRCPLCGFWHKRS